MAIKQRQEASIDWGVASRTLPGQSVSGDLHLVKLFPGGALIAVVDGLGHGDEAAVAARQAVSALESRAQDPVIPLVRYCHESLRKTRGVACSLVSLDFLDETITWLGVGNVEGVLLRADSSLERRVEVILGHGGVLGYRVPQLSAAVLPVFRGDMLILATDGVRSGFYESLNVVESPRKIAEHILAAYGRYNDDALVLVARYLGGK